MNFKVAAELRPTAPIYTNLAIAYVMLHRTDKAFSALRKAIALEPYSEPAVTLLADLAFYEGSNLEAIEPLEKLIDLEQKNSGIWARLARALIETGQNRKALDALKRQASNMESSSAFNNLGVVYARLTDKARALSHFQYAMQLAQDINSYDYMLAARNYLAGLTETGQYSDAIKFGRGLLEHDTNHKIAGDPTLSDCYVFLIFSLGKTDSAKEALRIARHLFNDIDAIAPQLKVWLATGLIAQYAMSKDKLEAGREIAIKALESVHLLDKNDKRINALKNNIAYLLIEMELLRDAADMLSQISMWIHVDPYPTATLGLLHLRKGHLEQGERLYSEAVQLASTAIDRQRISQKMNLELGKCLIEKDEKLARRKLQLAARSDGPIKEIISEASDILKRIGFKKQF